MACMFDEGVYSLDMFLLEQLFCLSDFIISESGHDTISLNSFSQLKRDILG